MTSNSAIMHTIACIGKHALGETKRTPWALMFCFMTSATFYEENSCSELFRNVAFLNKLFQIGMTDNTLRALKAYLSLNDKERMQLFDCIRELETMDKNVRSDYTKSLLSRKTGSPKVKVTGPTK